MKYSEMDDAKLIELTRKSDMAAYAALWERHATAALKVANSFSRTITPDDLVSEAYVNILETINRGHGPTTDFRPYLLGTVRNIVSRVAAKSKEDTFEDLEAVVDARQDGGIDTFYAGLGTFTPDSGHGVMATLQQQA
ncbi:sigma-70 family RNA polymerase sigma factor [Leucobacter coleopterorum]|uniref:Sigma-70 family RNA polymerase sigma factor n=1 Tax=Leucobacter coleopterorum TaxID=2714933 RepID=A0ABX6JWN5_9MICO|nr:sigma-70 family RNA polymerase sigma factor [Leucobacter coleopterorum]QIM18718.1 sigma-70 family RNA polymerase sigma factor [Leucobacter coleopterorum]